MFRLSSPQRNPKRNKFNAVCESLEDKQLLNASIISVDSIAPIIQGQTSVSVTFHYDATGSSAKASLAIDNDATGFVDEATGTNLQATLTRMIPANLSVGSHKATIHLVSPGKNGGEDLLDAVSFNVTLNVIPTTVVSVSGQGVYGGAGSVTATLDKASDLSAGISGKTINFYKSAVAPVNFLGSATTDASGVATLPSINSFGLNAGNQPITAMFEGDATYAASSGTGNLIIDKANANIVVTPYSVTYNSYAHTATGTATGVGTDGALSGLDLSGTTHTNAGTYTDIWTFTDTTGNYNDASGTVTDNIDKANAVINVSSYNVNYNGAAHTATGTATGVGTDGILSGLILSGTTHTNAGTYTDTWTFTDTTGNYKDASGTVTDNIDKVKLDMSVLTQAALNVAKNGTVAFTATEVDPSQVVDGQTMSQLFNGAKFKVSVNSTTYDLGVNVSVVNNQAIFSLSMSAGLKSALLSISEGSNANVPVIDAFTVTGTSLDSNYTFTSQVDTKVFSTLKS
jgi:hypothetical protein